MIKREDQTNKKIKIFIVFIIKIFQVIISKYLFKLLGFTKIIRKIKVMISYNNITTQ